MEVCCYEEEARAPAPAADESATRGVFPPNPGQGRRPLVLAPEQSRSPRIAISTTSTIYDAYDDDGPSPGSTDG